MKAWEALSIVVAFCAPIMTMDCTLTPEQAKSAHEWEDRGIAACSAIVAAAAPGYQGLCLLADPALDAIIDAETQTQKAPVTINLKPGQLSPETAKSIEKKEAHAQLLRAALAVKEHRAKGKTP